MNKQDLVSYTETVYGDALRLCGNSHRAEDLTQEVMLAALRQLDRGQDIHSPRTWLNHTLRNLFNQQLRRQYRLPTVTFGEYEMPDDLVTEDLHRLEQQEEYAALRRELANLSRLYRECMVLYYVKGRSVKEIADTLHLPENTVKSRLLTGRQKVKEGLQMEKTYTAQSYDPVRLTLSEMGAIGHKGEPFSLCQKSDVLTQNIVYAAYPRPLTEGEIARALGVSPAYVEPLVQKLVTGELMVRTDGGKVYTDCILFTAADRTRTFPLQQRAAAEQFHCLWPTVLQALEQLRRQPFYACQTETQRGCLETFFILFLLGKATVIARDRIVNAPEYALPHRRDGGSWIAIGSVEQLGDTLPAGYEQSVMSGAFSSMYTDAFGVKRTGYTELGMGGGDGHVADRLGGTSPRYVIEYLTAIATGKELADTSLSASAYNRLEDFAREGLVEREGDTLRLGVPVLDRAAYDLVMSELCEPVVTELADRLEAPLGPVVRAGEVPLPPHLTSVPRQVQFMHALGNLPMLFYQMARKELPHLSAQNALVFLLER